MTSLKNLVFNRIISCPYCHGHINKIRLINKSYGYCQCDCDQYPIIENIAIIKKDETLSNRVLVSLIKQNKLNSALEFSLRDLGIRYRLCILLMANHYYKINNIINPSAIFFLFKLISGHNLWFEYIFSRHKKNDFKLGINLLSKEVYANKSILVDLGCGVSQITNYLDLAKKENFTYLAIDKSLASLIISNKMFPYTNACYICSDFEGKIPLSDNSADRILFLDSFSFVLDKQNTIVDCHRVLKHKGKLFLINIHNRTEKTKLWSYGIRISTLKQLIRKKYKKNYFINHDSRTTSIIKNINKYKHLGYSCIAIKQ